MTIRKVFSPSQRFPNWREKLRIFHKKGWKTVFLWIAALGLGGALFGALGLTVALAWFSRDLPDPNTLMERNVPQSTKIYDRTSAVLLYEIHGEEKRTLIKLEDIPDVMKWSAIAVEDKSFYKHRGVNFKRIVKAILIDLIQRRKAQGASTLTQQFVKNAILTNEKSWQRKLKEVVMALQIERLYTKDQILQMYFNEIPYGSTIYGAESAAQSYFGKRAKDVTLDEAALLAALPQAPDFYSPYGTGSRGDNREKLLQRQRMILDLMAEQGYIKAEEADEAKKIDTLKKLEPKRVGDIKAPHFVTYVRSQLIEKYGQRPVEQGGLRVITSLDWKMQQVAEEEVKKGVDERGKKYGFTNGALVAIDPKTGQVLAMVGSRDFFDQENDGQVNVTIRPRQPGSSFKPIVYAAGFMKGYTPEMTLWDVQTKFKTDIRNYEPKNYDLKERGPLSVRQALQGSLNIPAVKMLYLVGVARVLDFAESLGYSTFEDRGRFGLALVLGGGEVKLLEHANAFAAFANEGRQLPLASILRVEDPKGKALEEWKTNDGRQVVEREVALQLSDVLSDNVSRAYIFGASNRLTLPDRPVAAKTGTTNNFHDAWTMGYVPQLAAGVWVGNNDNTEMKRGADGSVVAAPIWQNFMKRATKEMKAATFPKPQPTAVTKPILLGKTGEVVVKVDKVTGKRATAFTPPELIEERIFHEAHSELWYIDKDDPRGPAPANPAADPQFEPWESAVQAWATRAGWNVTSTPPTEEDDIHTPDNQPKVAILAPAQNTTLSSRALQVSLSVSSPRLINRVEATMNGINIGSSLGNSTSFTLTIPDSIPVGFHDLTITVVDDVGNKGAAIVTLNLAAENSSGSATIYAPVDGATLSSANFPVSVTVVSTNQAGAKNIDLYQEESQTGDTRLLGSQSAIGLTTYVVYWNSAPPAGVYYLYAVTQMQDGSSVQGRRITVRVGE